MTDEEKQSIQQSIPQIQPMNMEIFHRKLKQISSNQPWLIPSWLYVVVLATIIVMLVAAAVVYYRKQKGTMTIKALKTLQPKHLDQLKDVIVPLLESKFKVKRERPVHTIPTTQILQEIDNVTPTPSAPPNQTNMTNNSIVEPKAKALDSVTPTRTQEIQMVSYPAVRAAIKEVQESGVDLDKYKRYLQRQKLQALKEPGQSGK